MDWRMLFDPPLKRRVQNPKSLSLHVRITRLRKWLNSTMCCLSKLFNDQHRTSTNRSLQRISKSMIYLGYYVDSIDAGKRHCSPAAISKMDYLRDILIHLGYPVEIVSPAPSRIPHYLKKERRSLKEGGELVLFASFSYGNKIKNRLNEYFIKVQTLIHLHKNIKRNDTVIVYHSLALITIVNVMRMIKKCDFIYDVGELYHTVVLKKEEREMAFLKTADAYIFSTEFLNRKLNGSQKPYALMHGSYRVVPIAGNKLFDDNKIHCVYAGTFDIRKGVLLAIHSASFLGSRYHIHILGFGTDEETNNVKKLISDVSLRTDCKISYEGVIHGEEYIRFLQSCQIGLSPQSPDAQFNEASFPSKTLSYLSNGLKVVSIRIPAIEQSNIGAFLFYYDRQTPEAFAKAIEAAARDMSSNGQVIVKNLDEEFKNRFEDLISKLKLQSQSQSQSQRQ